MLSYSCVSKTFGMKKLIQLVIWSIDPHLFLLSLKLLLKFCPIRCWLFKFDNIWLFCLYSCKKWKNWAEGKREKVVDFKALYMIHDVFLRAWTNCKLHLFFHSWKFAERSRSSWISLHPRVILLLYFLYLWLCAS